MTIFQGLISNLRRRLVGLGIPFVASISEFDVSGVRFRIKSRTEYFRVIHHGGETDYLEAMLAKLRSDDILFDIGANIGMVSLHAGKICKTVAFEPDPSFRERLEGNKRLNPDCVLTVESIAISDSDSSVELFTEGADGNSPSLIRGIKSQSVLVQSRTLDSLISEGRLPRPSVIKMDIEGAEILALRGGREFLLSEDRPRTLFIEVHDTFLPDFGSTTFEVEELLKEFGYLNVAYREKRDGQTLLILDLAN